MKSIKWPKGTDNGAVSFSAETNDLGKPIGVENNAETQEDNGHGIPLSDDIKKSTQISSHKDQIETTVDGKSDGQRTEMVADGNKQSDQTDEEKGSNGDQGQSTSVVIEVPAHTHDDKKGRSQPIGDAIGAIPSEINEQSNKPSNNAGKPTTDEKSITKAERGVQGTENPSDHDGRVIVENPDNNDGKSTVQSVNDSTLAPAGQANSNTEKAGQSRNRTGGSEQAVESMTVIFHALLTPTFNINFQQGDKVVLRGDSPFSWKNPEQQLEIQDVRYVRSSFKILLFLYSFCIALCIFSYRSNSHPKAPFERSQRFDIFTTPLGHVGRC